MFLQDRSGGAAPRRLPLRTARSLLYTPLCCEAFFYKELAPLFHWLCYTYWEHDTFTYKLYPQKRLSLDLAPCMVWKPTGTAVR